MLKLFFIGMLFFLPDYSFAKSGVEILRSWGSGDKFVHRQNRSFDFHMAHPRKWRFNSKIVDANVETWEIDNSPVADLMETSNIKIDFLFNEQIEDSDSLYTWIKKNESNNYYFEPMEDPFSGFSTNEMQAPVPFQTYQIQYYLINRHQIIRLVKVTDPRHSGPQDMLDIMRSLQRFTDPPKILEVKIEDNSKSYITEDKPCYLIQVDDLKGSFDAKSVTKFLVTGQPAYWNHFEVEWLPKTSQLRVCLEVTSRFDKNGLHIEEFRIENNRDQSVRCKISEPEKSFMLNCSSGAINYQVQAIMGKVNNENPDRQGPTVQGIGYQGSSKKLKIFTEDDSGVKFAKVYPTFQRETDIDDDGVDHYVFFPNHLNNQGREIETKRKGWIGIEKIQLFDNAGNISILRIPTSGCKNRDALQELHYYELVQSNGDCESTNIPVVFYLQR